MLGAPHFRHLEDGPIRTWFRACALGAAFLLPARDGLGSERLWRSNSMTTDDMSLASRNHHRRTQHRTATHDTLGMRNRQSVRSRAENLRVRVLPWMRSRLRLEAQRRQLPETMIIRVGIWLALDELGRDPRPAAEQIGLPPELQARVPRLATPRPRGGRRSRGA